MKVVGSFELLGARFERATLYTGDSGKREDNQLRQETRRQKITIESIAYIP